MVLLLLLASAAAGSPAGPQEEPQNLPAAESEPRPDASAGDRPESSQAAAAQPFRGFKTFPPVNLDPQRQVWVGEPITLSLRDADLVEVLRSFAKLTDANLVIDPSVKGTVTVELRDVPWDQALYAILKINNLGMEISGNVWTTMPAKRLYEDE